MADVAAQMIIDQLGGRRFLAAAGARNLVASGSVVYFELPRCKGGINRLFIVLDADGMYTVEAGRWNRWTLKIEPVSREQGVLHHNLRKTFAFVTGLDGWL